MKNSESQPDILDADTDVGSLSVNASTNFDPSDSQTSLSGEFPCLTGYKVLRELGRGGMGVVYLAHDNALDRPVAIKTFLSNSGSEVLTTEARMSGKLNHPAIVPVFEVNTACGTPYFSMAFIDGENLAQRISRQVLAPEDAAKLGATAADALEHAHQAGILHLDIKPANILLDRAENVKVTDFGLFALIASTTTSEGILGTPQFMSPEQALNDTEKIGPASDVYSLGAVLYAAIAGRPPLVASNDTELVLRVASMRPKPLASFALHVPAALDAIIMKCLEKSPEHRYASAEELKEDLEAFLARKPIKARPHSFLAKIRYQIDQHVLAASVSGSMVLLLLLFTGISIVTQAVRNHFEVDRLQQEVISLETLQTQLRIAHQKAILSDQSLISEVSALALELEKTGDAKRAAIFAADAYLLGAEHGMQPDQGVSRIIREYREDWDSNSITLLEMANAIHDENLGDTENSAQ